MIRPRAGIQKTQSNPFSTDADDTLPPHASLLAEIRSGRRLVYPAGTDGAAILPSMAAKRVIPGSAQ